MTTGANGTTGKDFAVDTFRVLVVDDVALFAETIGRSLERLGIACDLAFTATEALERCGLASYGAILLDHKLPDDDGVRLIPLLLGRQPHASVLMMTAHETIQDAIRAIRLGAEDYIVKETSIRPIIDRVLEIQRRHKAWQALEFNNEFRDDTLIGGSASMRRVITTIEKVAKRSETTVLFTGETGVGKEVAARHLHAISPGCEGPFVSVDCLTLPDNLVESLLFGHEKGAFTGADRKIDGAFHEAGSGTILLDEIGDLDPALQGKLLRVLETRRYQRVGSVREHPVKARVIAATNRDVARMVEDGQFRMDLYQRLSMFPIHVPPLRDRGDDVQLLARHFVGLFGAKLGFEPEPLLGEVEERLSAYDFPGNIRELKNILERAMILADGEPIQLRHLPERVLDPPAVVTVTREPHVDFIPGIDTLETIEKKMIHHALTRAKGVKAEAAKLLGISRYQLLRRMDKYNMRAARDGS